MNYYHGFISLHGYMSGADSLEVVEQQILFLKQKASENNAEPCIVFMDVSEGRIYSENNYEPLLKVSNLIKKYSFLHYFIFDSDQQHFQPNYINDFDNVIWVDWFVIVNYMYNIGFGNQRNNVYWNSTAPTGLFTPGKIDRLHRCKLLGDMWQNNLLDKLTWSCVPSNKEWEHARHILNFNDSDFAQFKKDCTRELDIKMTDPTVDYNHIGYPYDVSLYKKTSFSVIAESDFLGVNSFIPKYTEKTYRAISNKHPIIFSYYPGIVKRFEEKGYKSFKNYLKIPDYNDIPNDKQRIKATIENITNFSNSIQSHRDMIKADIEYNFHFFVNRYNSEIQKLKVFLDLPNHTINMNPQTFIQYVWSSSIGKFEFQKVRW